MWVELITGFLGFLLIVITIGVIVYLTTKTRHLDIPLNAPLVRIYGLEGFTDGYVEGVMKSQKPRRNKTVLVEFYPVDIEQGWNRPKAEVQSLIVHKEFIRREAKGDNSSRREIISIFTRDPSLISKKIRNTELGKELTKDGQLAHITRTFGEMIPAGDEAIAEGMKNYARGNFPAWMMAQLREGVAEAKQMFQLGNPSEKKEDLK